jgi:hypothetical protein
MSDMTMGASYAEVPVEYWEAQADSWLAQLAEIRSLVTLPDAEAAITQVGRRRVKHRELSVSP